MYLIFYQWPLLPIFSQKSEWLRHDFFWPKVCGLLGKTPYIYTRYQVWGVTRWNFDLAYYHLPYSSLLCFGFGCETHCSKFSEKLTATRQLDLPMANFFFLASSVLYQSFGSTGRNYYFPDGYKKKSGAACVLKLSAREDAKSHCLHLFCLSPLCVFKCVLKWHAWEDA